MTTETQAAPAQEPQAQPQQQPTEPQANSFSVPQEYAGKGWIEKVKSVDDLWKVADNAQSLIGKRAAPAVDAPAEEWTAYMRQLGMPEKLEDYQLSDIDGIGETIDIAGYKTQAQRLMHEAGLTQRQADTLWKAFMASELKTAQAQSAELDKKYDELTAKHFGDKYADVETAAHEAIKAWVPEELRGAVANSSPETMIAMQALAVNAKAEIDRIRTEYGAEGRLPSGQAAPTASIEDSRKELAALRSNPASGDPTHKDYKANRARIDELSGIVRRALNGA